MIHRKTCAVVALILLLASGSAVAAKGDWWQTGDPLPQGDGGPEALPGDVIVCGSAATFDLFAGQSLDVGSVTVSNDEDTLYVTLLADGTYTFETLHVWVGIDLADVPSTPAGTPIPGQFPYQVDTNGGQQHTFELPLGTAELAAACGQTLYVVAHAEVVTDGGASGEHETAFGGDNPGGGSRWWYWMSYEIQCCDTPPGGGGLFETAFAKGGWVFVSRKRANPECLPTLRLSKGRWGWAIQVEDPSAAFVAEYEIWAGAGQNDTSRGTHVGTLTLTWDGTDLHVAYDLFEGWTMSEAQLYVGDAAPDTIAPGQYGWAETFDPYASTAEATFEGVLEGDADGDGFWVIAHAVVYGEPE